MYNYKHTRSVDCTQKIQRTFIRQHKHVDKHLNNLENITEHEYWQETNTKVPIIAPLTQWPPWYVRENYYTWIPVIFVYKVHEQQYCL